MGLDTTHGCWHGAYSAFSRWRTKLAEVAKYPPLDEMPGYKSGTYFDDKTGEKGLKYSWEPYATDPLVVLLHHSDCDGWIDVEWLLPLAQRLEELIAAAPDEDLEGHVGLWHAKTQEFIDGLRLAASLNERVEFH